jgi:asparagine synthase (glutamine-hydrolysing)
MCGICGLFTPCVNDDITSKLKRATSSLAHRGPNDSGIDLTTTPNGNLALGHTRLSIIDLTNGGHQPMHSTSGRFTIIFNGEIYNYRELRDELSAKNYNFYTNSDTEVLLTSWEAWGKNCLNKLTGMFAFVIFDKEQNVLYCARDAFGIKPLFYSNSTNHFAFASEIPALFDLLTSTPKPNLQAAHDYLQYGDYDESEGTFYDGIKQVTPGHLLTAHLNTQVQLKTERWWWPNIEQRCNLTFSQAADELRERFLENIRLHLRSDVKVGATLSGGIDSSAIACAMRYVDKEIPISTFSYVPRQRNLSEEPYIDIVTSHINAISHKIETTSKELDRDGIDLTRTQGEPFGGTSIYAQYRVFEMVSQSGVIVTLDGQGADELLGGYNGFPSHRLMSLLDTNDYNSAFKFLLKWSRWPNRSFARGVGSLLRHFTARKHQAIPRWLAGHSPSPKLINKQNLYQLGIIRFNEQAHPEWTRGRRVMATLRHNMSGGELSKLLRHSDRNSMRWSVECRTPFLTTGLADFLLSLPEEYLISLDGQTKRIFRAAMRGIVPDAILDRRDKIGFASPDSHLGITIGRRCLTYNDAFRHLPFLNRECAIDEIASYTSKRKPLKAAGWRLINLVFWANEAFPPNHT